jgi:hypothetical protein
MKTTSESKLTELDGLRVERTLLRRDLEMAEEQLRIQTQERARETKRAQALEMDLRVSRLSAKSLEELHHAALKQVAHHKVVNRVLVDHVVRLEQELEKLRALRTESSK